MIYKENTKEVLFRKIIPINKFDNTYKQICTGPIIKNVKDIKYSNKINDKNNSKSENQRDYSNFDWTSLYANNFTV